MTDTPPEIARLVREKIMARSGEERFVMGGEKFEAAKVMICASFPLGLAEPEKKAACSSAFMAMSRAWPICRPVFGRLGSE
jgi:hypothetical protein